MNYKPDLFHEKFELCFNLRDKLNIIGLWMVKTISKF